MRVVAESDCEEVGLGWFKADDEFAGGDGFVVDYDFVLCEDVVGDGGVGFGAHDAVDGVFDGAKGCDGAIVKTAFADKPVSVGRENAFIDDRGEHNGIFGGELEDFAWAVGGGVGREV